MIPLSPRILDDTWTLQPGHGNVNNLVGSYLTQHIKNNIIHLTMWPNWLKRVPTQYLLKSIVIILIIWSLTQAMVEVQWPLTLSQKYILYGQKDELFSVTFWDILHLIVSRLGIDCCKVFIDKPNWKRCCLLSFLFDNRLHRNWCCWSTTVVVNLDVVVLSYLVSSTSTCGPILYNSYTLRKRKCNKM